LSNINAPNDFQKMEKDARCGESLILFMRFKKFPPNTPFNLFEIGVFLPFYGFCSFSCLIILPRRSPLFPYLLLFPPRKCLIRVIFDHLLIEDAQF